jgi:primase-polymerase (primpol)-like protein
MGHAVTAPDDLVERDQWVVWRYESRNGGPSTKVPYRADGHGKASSTDPVTWTSFEEAHAAYLRNGFDGVGFVFSESDPFCGLDLDNCLHDTTGDPKPWCRGLLERFSDSYMEFSPSGLGIKIWARGKLPAAIDAPVEDGNLEMYDRARYFTVTGQAFRGAPLQIEDHASDVLYQWRLLTGRGTAHREIPTESKIPYGTQHVTLVSLAGTLRRRKVCDQAIEACLQAVNRHQCERPGPPRNISRIVASSRAWRHV